VDSLATLVLLSWARGLGDRLPSKSGGSRRVWWVPKGLVASSSALSIAPCAFPIHLVLPSAAATLLRLCTFGRVHPPYLCISTHLHYSLSPSTFWPGSPTSSSGTPVRWRLRPHGRCPPRPASPCPVGYLVHTTLRHACHHHVSCGLWRRYAACSRTTAMSAFRAHHNGSFPMHTSCLGGGVRRPVIVPSCIP